MATMQVAASTSSSAVNLPQRLLNFFARYPPRLYGAHFTRQRIETLEEKIAREGNKKTGEAPTIPKATPPSSLQQPSVQPNSTQPLSPTAAVLAPSQSEADPSSSSQSTDLPPLLDPETSQPIFSPADQPPNPFLPYRNPANGRWRGPVVSLRRQAELFKLARLFDVEPLLPASRKATAFKEERLLRRLDGGAQVQGTGEGMKVKGHKWERKLGPLLERRIKAMEEMPALIREWRVRGNGRDWKKWPSSRSLKV